MRASLAPSLPMSQGPHQQRHLRRHWPSWPPPQEGGHGLPCSPSQPCLSALPLNILDTHVEGKPVREELAIRTNDPSFSKIAAPSTAPTALFLAKTWALSLHTLATKKTGGTLVSNRIFDLVQLLFLLTVCALLRSRHSDKVGTTAKGLLQLAIVGSLHLCTISNSNKKPKGLGTSTRYRLTISSSSQRAHCCCYWPWPPLEVPHPGRHSPGPPGSDTAAKSLNAAMDIKGAATCPSTTGMPMWRRSWCVMSWPNTPWPALL